MSEEPQDEGQDGMTRVKFFPQGKGKQEKRIVSMLGLLRPKR